MIFPQCCRHSRDSEERDTVSEEREINERFLAHSQSLGKAQKSFQSSVQEIDISGKIGTLGEDLAHPSDPAELTGEKVT